MKIVKEGYDSILDLKYYIDIVDNETGEVLKQYNGHIPRSYVEEYDEESIRRRMMDNISRRRDLRKWMDDNLLKIARMEIPSIKDMKIGKRPTWTIYVKPINGEGE